VLKGKEDNSMQFDETMEPPVRKHLKTSFGIFAKYGRVPSAEEIDENRREMFRNFAQDQDSIQGVVVDG